MKLIACHVENFGKLSDLTLQFEEGLNVFNESNAWGKSTLAAFLKAMFYGLDAKKASGAFDKERVMYRPWQGGAFGGEVDFEVNGKQYRISRSFGRTEKADEFHLYDLSTNLESNDFSQDVGAELFELDSASFKRSIYIAQNDCASETSDGINAKLGNLAENTDDINNFESANQQLKDILNQLTPDRVTGSIKKRKNYITQLAQELRAYESAQEGFDGVQRKAQAVALDIQELLAIRKNYVQALVVASEDSRKKALHAQYDAMCKEVNEKENKMNAYKSYFQLNIPTEAEFQEQIQNVSKMNEAQAAARSYEMSVEEMDVYGKLQEMFADSVPKDSDIDSVLLLFNEIDKHKEEIARQESKLVVYRNELEEVPVEPKFVGSVAYKVFLFAGIGIAILGLGALLAWYFHMVPSIEQNILLIGAIAAGACGAIFGFVGSFVGVRVYKDKQTWKEMMDADKNEVNNKINNVNDLISNMRESVRKTYSVIGGYLGKFRVYCEVGEYQAKLYALKTQAQEYLRMKEQQVYYEQEMVRVLDYKRKLIDFKKLYQLSFNEEDVAGLNLLQTKASEYQMAIAAYQEVFFKRETFEKKQDKSFWTKEAACPYTLDELNELITQTDARLEELKAAKTQYDKQIEALQEQLDMRDEKEAELQELYQEQEKDSKRYQILKLTQEYLQTAKEQFTARYMAPIANAFGKYYGKLTGDKSENWMIDANINLKLREQGELRETHWLSAGYQDLIGVCMRLALVDTMYQEEKPFLILDDPFVNLDQEKVACGNELLESVAKEYQVIYFTCHDSRCPVIK